MQHVDDEDILDTSTPPAGRHLHTGLSPPRFRSGQWMTSHQSSNRLSKQHVGIPQSSSMNSLDEHSSRSGSIADVHTPLITNSASPSISQPNIQSVDLSTNRFSVRSALVGLFVGTLLCFSNMYFGLQTGWVTMGSLQAVVLGYGLFSLTNRLPSGCPTPAPLQYYETVLIQTVSVAMASIPLAAGFVGIVPALAIMTSNDSEIPTHMNWWQMMIWALSLVFFGVFFAVPLRNQTIVKEKLTFPSGTATARLIEILHKLRNSGEDDPNRLDPRTEHLNSFALKWKVLGGCFAVSSIITILTYFIPEISNLKIFSWIGLSTCTDYLWTFQMSFGYIGQGMIMGPHSALSMLLGAVIGFGILSPLSKVKGWAPGSISSWTTGGQGWILWISLTMMTCECFSSLCVLVYNSIPWSDLKKFIKMRGQAEDDDRSISNLDFSIMQRKTTTLAVQIDAEVPHSWWIAGLFLSSVSCILVMCFLFDQKFYEPFSAILFAFVVSILSVRALGETDLNPVSGIGKLSQIFFGVISPGNLVGNVIAGAIAEAGAMQAGDIMQTFKTGYLLHTSPRAQYFGTLLGSSFSVIVSIAAYQLYVKAYGVPSEVLPAPTAQVWIEMADLMNGGKLAPYVTPFCVAFGLFSALIPIINASMFKSKWIPSAVAMAVGMYVTPNWTLARVLGSLGHLIWEKLDPQSHGSLMIIAASGFVLGEGVMSIIAALLKNFHVAVWA